MFHVQVVILYNIMMNASGSAIGSAFPLALVVYSWMPTSTCWQVVCYLGVVDD